MNTTTQLEQCEAIRHNPRLLLQALAEYGDTGTVAQIIEMINAQIAGFDAPLPDTRLSVAVDQAVESAHREQLKHDAWLVARYEIDHQGQWL